MATKSILKNINIKTNYAAIRLADALTYAKERPAQPVKFQHSYSDATKEDILKMFGEHK